jgi:hypothetical protein
MSVFKKDIMKHTLKYSSTFPSSDYWSMHIFHLLVHL